MACPDIATGASKLNDSTSHPCDTSSAALTGRRRSLAPVLTVPARCSRCSGRVVHPLSGIATKPCDLLLALFRIVTLGYPVVPLRPNNLNFTPAKPGVNR